jgi:hypothetical protein
LTSFAVSLTASPPRSISSPAPSIVLQPINPAYHQRYEPFHIGFLLTASQCREYGALLPLTSGGPEPRRAAWSGGPPRVNANPGHAVRRRTPRRPPSPRAGALLDWRRWPCALMSSWKRANRSAIKAWS